MKEISNMSLIELAAFISSHLRINGIENVLTGGACVSIYTENKYQSKDLDFIEIGIVTRKELKKVMANIGFKEKNRYFISNETDFFVEFPSGPLAIGSEIVRDIHEIKVSTGLLRLLSATDCVKDRLAAYYFWDDQQSLDQATMVAQHNVVDVQEVERWSEAEGQIEKFKLIKKIFDPAC